MKIFTKRIKFFSLSFQDHLNFARSSLNARRGPRTPYSKELLEQAVDAIINKTMKYRAAQKAFNIPCASIYKAVRRREKLMYMKAFENP